MTTTPQSTGTSPGDNIKNVKEHTKPCSICDAVIVMTGQDTLQVHGEIVCEICFNLYTRLIRIQVMRVRHAVSKLLDNLDNPKYISLLSNAFKVVEFETGKLRDYIKLYGDSLESVSPELCAECNKFNPPYSDFFRVDRCHFVCKKCEEELA